MITALSLLITATRNIKNPTHCSLTARCSTSTTNKDGRRPGGAAFLWVPPSNLPSLGRQSGILLQGELLGISCRGDNTYRRQRLSFHKRQISVDLESLVCMTTTLLGALWGVCPWYYLWDLRPEDPYRRKRFKQTHHERLTK